MWADHGDCYNTVNFALHSGSSALLQTGLTSDSRVTQDEVVKASVDQCRQGIEAQHYLCTMQQQVSGKLYIDRTKDVAAFRALLTNVKAYSRLNFLSRVFLVCAGLLRPAHMETQPTLRISDLLVIPGVCENRLKELSLSCLKEALGIIIQYLKGLQDIWRGASE